MRQSITLDTLERFPKSVQRFWDKKRDKTQEGERLVSALAQVKIAPVLDSGTILPKNLPPL